MQTNASPATGTGIRHRDLTLATGAPAAVGQPRGYAFDAQKTGHVMFRGADDRVHELWWEESGWHLGDLSRAAPASAICVSELAAYVFSAQATQHVMFRGADDHVHELWWDRRGWHQSDLTAASGAPVASGGPAGCAFDGENTQHVVFRGIDDHVH